MYQCSRHRLLNGYYGVVIEYDFCLIDEPQKGSYECDCHSGYELTKDPTFQVKLCVDINECFNATTCGGDQKCHNTV